MGGSKINMFLRSDFPKTLPQRRGHRPEWKNREKSGVNEPVFEGRAVENFSPTLNISQTGGAIFTKFSRFVGLMGASLQF